MNKKPLILTLAAPVLGLAIYTIFHDCQKWNCFFCQHSRKITFVCGGAAAGLLAWYLKK